MIDDTVYVSLKLVSSNDFNLTSDLIRSTNRQTAINDQDLIAFSDFQRVLEDYYKTHTGVYQLYYERRSKQFNNYSIERNRIVDKATQIKVMGSFVYGKPEMSTRYFGALFSEFKDRLFKPEHNKIVYYVSAFAFFKIQELLKKGVIPVRLKKFKYFILMMLKYELIGLKNIQFDSNKTTSDFEDVLSIINDEEAFKKIIDRINDNILSISENEFDLDSLETSKLKLFADKCKSFYLPNKD